MEGGGGWRGGEQTERERERERERDNDGEIQGRSRL